MSSGRLNFHRYEPVEWRLLLVTDGSPGALQLQRHLERSGYRVTTAAHAQDALAMLESGRFHILITDWNVAGMDGGALCRALRSEDLPGYVYTLVITEPEAKSHIVEALEAGADDSLAKPISESELLARLSRAIAARSERGEPPALRYRCADWRIQPAPSGRAAAARNRALSPLRTRTVGRDVRHRSVQVDQ